MRDIVLARIDDRLIHGQVITAWVKHVGANAIVIVDNELAKNKLMQRIYVASTPSDTELKILSMEEAIEYLKGGNSSSKVLVLAKVPQILEELIEREVNISDVILGGMGSNATRKKIIRNAYANDDEVDSMKRMMKKGISVSFQLVPDEKNTDLNKVL